MSAKTYYHWPWLVLMVVLALAGCPWISDEMKTGRIVEAWSCAVSTHLLTGSTDGNFALPLSLDQIDPQLTVGLTDVDAWGNKLFYRVLRGDTYNLISAGPDGELGNDDDIVMENGLFYEAATIYGRAPLDR